MLGACVNYFMLHKKCCWVLPDVERAPLDPGLKTQAAPHAA